MRRRLVRKSTFRSFFYLLLIVFIVVGGSLAIDQIDVQLPTLSKIIHSNECPGVEFGVCIARRYIREKRAAASSMTLRNAE